MIKKFGNYETRRETGDTGASYSNILDITNSARYQSHSIGIQNYGAETMFAKVLLYKDVDSLYPEEWVSETSIAVGDLLTVDLIEKPCARILVQAKNNSGSTSYEVASTSRGKNA
jgi:hypothetical protein